MADGRLAIRKHSKDVYCKTLDDASADAGGFWRLIADTGSYPLVRGILICIADCSKGLG